MHKSQINNKSSYCQFLVMLLQQVTNQVRKLGYPSIFRHKTSYSLPINAINAPQSNSTGKKKKILQHNKINYIRSVKSVKETNFNTIQNNIDAKKKEINQIQLPPKLRYQNLLNYYESRLKKSRKQYNKIIRNSLHHKKCQQQLGNNSVKKICLFRQRANINNIFRHAAIQENDQKKTKTIITPPTLDINDQVKTGDRRSSFQKYIDKAKPKSQRKNWSVSKWEQPGWANNEIIDKLFKYIRDSHEKKKNQYQTNQISQLTKQLQKSTKPLIQNSQKKSICIENYKNNRICNTQYSKYKNIIKQNGFITLQPWSQDTPRKDIQFEGIEDYPIDYMQQF